MWVAQAIGLLSNPGQGRDGVWQQLEQPYLGPHCPHPHMGGLERMPWTLSVSPPLTNSPWLVEIPNVQSNTERNSKVVPLVLGAWNVWTLLDNPHADCSQRRIALVARELGGCGFQITVLSKVHFTGEGHLMGHGSGFTFYWSGHGAGGHCMSGVGFAVRAPLMLRLLGLPRGLDDHLVTL